MKCEKHPEEEMEVISSGAGWSRAIKRVCRKCEKEALADGNKGIFSSGKAGWQ